MALEESTEIEETIEVDEEERIEDDTITFDDKEIKQKEEPIQIFTTPLFSPESYCVQHESIPALSPYQREDFFEKGGRLFNTSSLGSSSEELIKIHEWLIKQNEKEESDRQEELTEIDSAKLEPSDKVSRILYGLQELTKKFRENMYNIVDPPILDSRKERRLNKKKMFQFQQKGFKDMISLMEKHMQVLITYGHYEKQVFKNFQDCAKKALDAQNQEEALGFGMDVLLCAEAVMPMEEMIMPQRRISEGIATPSAQ